MGMGELLRAHGRFIEWQTMSGHSKWHSIKHKKAAVDAKRGKQFTKLARAVTVAASEAGGTPTEIPPWRPRSRRRAMPRCRRTTSSGRSIAAPARAPTQRRSSGSLRGLRPRRSRNPGRDPDRQPQPHQRRGPPRLQQARGSLGEPGSVAWIFEKRGVIIVDGARYSEDDMIPAIDAGARLLRRGEGGAPRTAYRLRPEESKWFDHWLKDIENGVMAEPPVAVFVRGWQSFSAAVSGGCGHMAQRSDLAAGTCAADADVSRRR